VELFWKEEVINGMGEKYRNLEIVRNSSEFDLKDAGYCIICSLIPMKTHVIQLAAHDDYHSVRDQMTWAKSARILLVLPKKGNILESKLDLVMLERLANDLGSQIAIVTDDEIIIGNAEDLKIPVFETINEAQRQTWKTARKHKIYISGKNRLSQLLLNSGQFRTFESNGKQSSWLRVAIFGVGVISLLILLLSPVQKLCFILKRLLK
jgi:hypothetical protein